MQVGENTVVTFDYQVTDSEGDLLDSSEGRDPFAYLFGSGGIIPGLENALNGRTAGDSFEATIAPGDAYGEWAEDLVEEVPKDQFQVEGDIEAGMQFQAMTAQGPRVVTVTSTGDESVTVDANHPLAGKTLTFQVEVVDVRAATDEEVAHGHAHGPGHEHGHGH